MGTHLPPGQHLRSPKDVPFSCGTAVTPSPLMLVSPIYSRGAMQPTDTPSLRQQQQQLTVTGKSSCALVSGPLISPSLGCRDSQWCPCIRKLLLMHQGVEKRDTTAFSQKRFSSPHGLVCPGLGGILEVLADPEIIRRVHSTQGLGAGLSTVQRVCGLSIASFCSLSLFPSSVFHKQPLPLFPFLYLSLKCVRFLACQYTEFHADKMNGCIEAA